MTWNLGYTDHYSDINDVAWFPDNKSFVAGGDDNRIILWDVNGFEAVNVYESRNVYDVVTSVDCSKSEDI